MEEALTEEKYEHYKNARKGDKYEPFDASLGPLPVVLKNGHPGTDLGDYCPFCVNGATYSRLNLLNAHIAKKHDGQQLKKIPILSMESDPFGTFTQWFVSVFDLSTCNEIGNGGGGGGCDKRAQFSLPERRIDFPSINPPTTFLLDGWLVVPGVNELAWYDKEGKRSETSTKLVTHKLTIFASRSVLLFDTPGNNKMLLMKQVCLDGEFST